MANKITWKVNYDINKQSLNDLKSSLEQINKLKVSDIMKINDMDRKKANETLVEIRREAGRVLLALKKAFNAKLGTTNFTTFKSTLKDLGTSVLQVYSRFNKAGTVGENAFRSLTVQTTKLNTQLKQSHTVLDRMATTLSNTLKWNAASTVINGLSNGIQQAWGYVKSLDTSLNDIRVVTGKSSELMEKFAVKANLAAQSLGRTTTDYTKAALIYAQQGNGPKIFEADGKRIGKGFYWILDNQNIKIDEIIK